MSFNMRWMKEKDVSCVLKIQGLNFNSNKFDSDFLYSIVKGRHSLGYGYEGTDSYISYVCEFKKKIVGYIVYQVGLLDFELNLHSNQMVKYKDINPMMGTILNFCVHKNYRRQGVGSHIIETVLQKFSSVIEFSLKDSRPRPFLIHSVVSEKDLDAHVFLSKMNFLAKYISWNFFEEGHDGYNFVYENLKNSISLNEKNQVLNV